MITTAMQVELRFLIIKIVKESKKKMTIDEIIMKPPFGRVQTYRDYIPDAICELYDYGILEVEFKKGFSSKIRLNNSYEYIVSFSDKVY